MTVIGYPSLTSVVPGDSIELHLSADTPGPTTLKIERIGTLPISMSLSASLSTLAVPNVNPWEGFGWPTAATFRVPVDWPSGIYVLRTDTANVLSFVVRSATPGATSTVLRHISFLTHAAYNAAGGKRLYGFNSSPNGQEADRASKVSLLRPHGFEPPGSGLEGSLGQWMEDEGTPVEYCSSIDLHVSSDLLMRYECLELARHDEYRTKPMRDHVERFVTNGGNVIALSGNTCYRAVRLEDANNLVVFHKYAGNDLNPNNETATVAWAEPPINRPQNSLLGAGFTHGAFSGPKSPYTIRFPMHWVFTGLTNPTVTSAFMDYETDAASYVEEPEGYPRVTGEEGTPLSFTILASADCGTGMGSPDVRPWASTPATGRFSMPPRLTGSVYLARIQLSRK